MTPEEAMKKISAWQIGKGNPSYDKLNRALNLGIEALRRCRHNYLNPQRADFRRLPGETEE